MKIKVATSTIPPVTHEIELGPDATRLFWIVFEAQYKRFIEQGQDNQSATNSSLKFANQSVTLFLKHVAELSR